MRRKNFFKKYFDVLQFHYEETLQTGIEIVSLPLYSLQKAKDFIQMFFDDYKNQDKWFFNFNKILAIASKRLGNFSFSGLNLFIIQFSSLYTL